MSHFAVAVITSSKPSDEELAAALQPWHEFECTGHDDEYVVHVDETDKARCEYESDTKRMVRTPEGDLVSAYDDRFYRDPNEEQIRKHGPILGTGSGGGDSWHSKDWGDGKGHRTKFHHIPDECERVEVPTPDIQSFKDYVVEWYGRDPVLVSAKPDLADKHKYGFCVVDARNEVVKVVNRTNPNSRWDWWVIGGRYSGKLRTKSGEGLKGKPGLMGSEWDKNGVDQAMLGDVDFKTMARDNSRSVSDSLAVNLAEIMSEHHIETVDDARAHWRRFVSGVAATKSAWEKAQRPGAFYQFIDSQADHGDKDAEAIRHPISALSNRFGVPDHVEDPVAWANNQPALSAWAVVKDGEWFEKGEMGWWAISHGDKADWQQQFDRILADTPSDHWITIVDCHI